jgi:hypothetical protein
MQAATLSVHPETNNELASIPHLQQRGRPSDARLKQRVIGDGSRRGGFRTSIPSLLFRSIPVSAVSIPVMRVRPDFLDVEFHAAA